MAHIAILVDFFPGHFFPTLGLARALSGRGHRVQYLGVPDVGSVVREQGFEFTEIMADLLPLGSADALRREVGFDPENEKLAVAAQQRYFAPLVKGDVLDAVVRRFHPDVILTLSFLGIEALVIHYRYNLPIVLLVPFIRDETRQQYFHGLVSRLLDISSGLCEFVEMASASERPLKSLSGLTDTLTGWPELALYAKAFDLPGKEDGPSVLHIGAEFQTTRQEIPFPWRDVDAGRPLVYCSLGSRPRDYGDVSHRLFAAVLAAVADRSDWQVILAVGPDLGPEDFPCQPPHVILLPWVPQIDVLKRAAVMITHAGMGAVNECLLTGVPMVAFPLARDQHQNAARIVHHGIGVASDANTLTAGEVRQMLEQVIGDPAFRVRVASMQQRCAASDTQDGVRLVERIIQQRGDRFRAIIEPAAGAAG
jgi:zeaxanthin glucosyltransferase